MHLEFDDGFEGDVIGRFKEAAYWENIMDLSSWRSIVQLGNIPGQGEFISRPRTAG